MQASSSNDALNDEIEALTSIYDLSIITITKPGSAASDKTEGIFAHPATPITFHITFPQSYPDVPPSITGTHHVGASTKPGEGEAAADALRQVLARIFTSGQVCLFDLVEEAGPFLAHIDQPHVQEAHENEDDDRDADQEVLNAGQSPIHKRDDGLVQQAPELQWTLSDPLTVQKSTFIARCLQVTSSLDVANAISHLLAKNKKVAAATHNISAWRLKRRPTLNESGKSLAPTAEKDAETSTAPEIITQDCDDDGETAAGGRLLHLMQLMDVWNCVVVVSRWYGGVKLGPDRFRLINEVAREAILRSGFGRKGEGQAEKGSGRKGRKK